MNTITSYNDYFKSYQAFVLQKIWRDDSIKFLDAHITPNTVAIVGGSGGARLGVSRAITGETYVISKERIEQRFLRDSDEHYNYYRFFLKVLKNLEELQNVSDDVLHSEDFLQGLEEDKAFQATIKNKIKEIQQNEQTK